LVIGLVKVFPLNSTLVYKEIAIIEGRRMNVVEYVIRKIFEFLDKYR
jgi:hypothetical protein